MSTTEERFKDAGFKNHAHIVGMKRVELLDFIRAEITLAVQEERNRLKEKAQEYKDKGFELETFIYSGFIN